MESLDTFGNKFFQKNQGNKLTTSKHMVLTYSEKIPKRRLNIIEDEIMKQNYLYF